MPTATVERKTPDGVELERWEKVRSDRRFDAGQSYIVSSPHDCARDRCQAKLDKVHEPFSGRVAHQLFVAGRAQVVGLTEAASSAEIEQRLADLDYFANGNYRIQKARFLQASVEEEAD